MTRVGASSDRITSAGRATRPAPAVPELDTFDSALALARWENEGGRSQMTSESRESGNVITPRSRERRSISRVKVVDAHISPATEVARENACQSYIRVGRVYDERGPHDQLRVLVDRLWPRGLSKTRADLDEWCKAVAPSAPLRVWYSHDPDRFAEFERRYRQELDHPDRSAALSHLREMTRGRTVALLTATRDPEISEAAVIAHVLRAEEPIYP